MTNLEEIKKISDLELEYRLHQLTTDNVELTNHQGERWLIPRKFRHQAAQFPEAKGDEPIDLGADSYKYARSLDAVSIVEKIVIEKFGGASYMDDLMEVVDYDLHNRGHLRTFNYQRATASARQRAEACLLALEQPLESAAADVHFSSADSNTAVSK